MATSFSLVAGGTTITLSSLSAVSPVLNRDLGEIVHETLTGNIYVYQNSNKADHQLMVNNVSKHDADHINAWKVAGTTIVYTDYASVTYNVKIVNTGVPLSWMPDTTADSLFQGTIMLRQI